MVLSYSLCAATFSRICLAISSCWPESASRHPNWASSRKLSAPETPFLGRDVVERFQTLLNPCFYFCGVLLFQREKSIFPSHTKSGAKFSLPRHGAEGRTRTGTVSPPVDFESTTSANSITPANPYIIITNFHFLCKAFL